MLNVVNKLKSKKGSSLLLSLLFSIICLLLGVVILTAGVTANGRIINAAKSEQSYFMVSSVFSAIDYETRVETGPLSNRQLTELRFTMNIDSAAIADQAANEAAIYPLDGTDDLRLGALRPYLISAIKGAVRDNQNQVRTMEFSFGEELGANYRYAVSVTMTVMANDYSIYFDITDIRKVSDDPATPSESVGVPNLHTIAVEAKRVVPTVIRRDVENNNERVWVVAEFEYHRAKYVK